MRVLRFELAVYGVAIETGVEWNHLGVLLADEVIR